MVVGGDVLCNYIVLFGGRFPQAKTAITENHPLEFSEKHVSNLCSMVLSARTGNN